tara:strand:- start:468 stop:593 length:126 start_codon:yes stop_codon:yes gene_type:complete
VEYNANQTKEGGKEKKGEQKKIFFQDTSLGQPQNAHKNRPP